MAKFFTILFLLGFIFCGAYYAGTRKAPRKDWVHPQVRFQPSPYPLVNRSFAIVIIGHNNGAFVEKTLRSAFSQNYPNYRIIYVDDASDDGSCELVRELIEAKPILFQQNKEPLGVASNLQWAVDACEDEEIVVVLGGEDWLAHEWVLARLNQYYANPELWMTYGQYREYPGYALGRSCPPEMGKLYREQPFSASHLTTFYADLFKQIYPDDLSVQGTFYLPGAEIAMMVPMLEMADDHAGFIPEILYIVNGAIEGEDPEIANRCEREVRNLASYSPLKLRHAKRAENIEPDEEF